jgi:hypothetical protein
MSLHFAPILCYSFYYLVKWNNKVKGCTYIKSCKPFWNAKCWEFYICRYTTTQDICSSQNKNKNIWQLHLPLNMTNSNSYCYNSRHDDHKFIGEHMCFEFYDHFQWYYIKKPHTHTTPTHTYDTLLLLPGAELSIWKFWPSQRPLSISLDLGHWLSSF